MLQQRKRLALVSAAALATAAGALYLRGTETVRAAEAPEEVEGLRFRLSEGKPQNGEVSVRNPIAPAEKLSDADADRVLARLPAIKAQPDDEVDFALRESSLPAPRAGQTILTEFPPKISLPAPVVETGALSVRRVQPEGDVPLADRISITFSQPMVPVTGQEDAAARVPVILSPTLPGKWRWLGTQTLVFDAGQGKRLPMSTEYRLRIPAGTKSILGNALEQEASFTFKTPSLRLLGHGPTGTGQRRDPLIWMTFDQKIDPNAVLKKLSVSALSQPVKVRLATDTELKELGKRETPERWLVVKPVSLLPGDSDIRVRVGEGTPSAEGPRVTEGEQSFSFRTYGPLKVVQQWPKPDQPVPPGASWQVQFSNELNAEAFDPAWVSISPAVPGFKPMASGNFLYLNGEKKANTTYTVRLSPKLRDIFGQNLEGAEPLTFKIGAAEQQLTGPGEALQVPDPAAPPRIVFKSANVPTVKVKFFAVSPSDWDAWREWQSKWEERRKGATPPGKLLREVELPLTGAADTLHENELKLPSAGNVIVWWEAQGWKKRSPADEPPRGASWVQSTPLGLTAFADNEELFVWATELTSGKPLSGVEVQVVGSGQKAVTGPDGLLRFPLNEKTGTMLLAQRGKQSAFLPARLWRYDESGWKKQNRRGPVLRFFTWDDRQLYKPGETVHIKGWARREAGTKLAGLEIPSGISAVYTLRDSRGNELQRKNITLNAWGGFDLTLELPKTMNLGQAQVLVTAEGSATVHTFNVQEFRRPEFEVAAKNENPGPHLVQGPGVDLSVKASYYAGGVLPGAQVTWTANANATTYTPPGRSEFTFGKWTPWWRSDSLSPRPLMMGGRGGFGGRGIRQAVEGQSLAGVTDALGVHRLHIDLDGVKPARPYTISAQAAVQDVNRQTWAASTSVLVHPSERYVGLKSKRYFVEKGKPLPLDVLVCDIDGKAEANQEVQFSAVRREWEWTKGRYQEVVKEKHEWVVRSEKAAVSTQFQPKEGGQWSVTAVVRDRKERANETELTLWVAGGKPDPRKDLTQQQVTLIPSAKDYAPGQTAELLVQSPFFPAEGVLTLRREGIIKTERFRMETATTTLKIPLAASYLPNIHAHVELVGSAERTDDDGKALTKLARRPAFAQGELDLSLSLASRKLTVVAKPDKAALSPGGETRVSVSVKDASGKPLANSEVALAVVDESVQALAGWSLGDPVAVFHPRRSSEVSDWHLRSYVKLEDPLLVAPQMETAGMMFGGMPGAPMGGGMMGSKGRGGFTGGRPGAPPVAARMSALSSESEDRGNVTLFKAKGMVADKKDASGGEQDSTPIAVRSNFDPLALFVASAKTDSDGQVQIPVKLPDNLTRYRIVAVAVAGANQAGSGEASLTARLPLMARPSAPRFLNIGDQFELPVVLQNQTESPMTVDVAVRATNATLTDGRGRRVTIPANDRVEVRFPTEAAKPGTARFQLAAVAGSPIIGGGGGMSDAAEVSLPVWTPTTTEAFATYGVLDKGAAVQPVRAPSDALPQFGELEVTTSSTALQELTDAMIYLAQYPYGCSEQISSRVLATAALKDVLSAFKAAGMPKAEELNAAMKRDLERLAELQNPDGSYGFWAHNERSWPYLGVHVAHALVRAKQKDFAVPQDTYGRSMGYLKAIETKFEPDFPVQCRRMITAYALYVRHLAGDSDKARAKSLLAEAPLDELGPETVGWLLNVLAGDPSVQAARTWLNNKVTETAAAAHFAFSYRDSSYLVLSSDRRADAIVLEALIADQPNSDLIPKLVRGLLDGRKRGCWSSTQENAFVLLALDRYFRKFEGVTPDFVARLWLGEKFAGEGTFKGRTTDRVATKIPMRYLTETPGAQVLTIGKEGAGRLYYRIGMRYAPKSLKLAAADYGFAVSRRYEAIDKPEDVRQDADGTWVIKAGAKVRVKVSMVSTTRRFHVALVDPLPAGLEALNPELRGTPIIGGGGGGWRYWSWWNWYEHQNLRDERAEAFCSLLWEGAYEYTYVCRATTPGTFVVPPAKAEEMYTPETFGRSASDKVRVE